MTLALGCWKSEHVPSSPKSHEKTNINRQRDHASASLLAEVNALMLDLRRAPIPVPLAPKGTEVEKWLEMASVYFSHLGPLLRDGHVGEAKGVASLVQLRLGKD